MNDLAGKTLPAKDGFTEAQRFFLAFGQIWCDNEREELKRQQIQTNPHSSRVPRQWSGFEYAGVPQAFGCKIVSHGQAEFLPPLVTAALLTTVSSSGYKDSREMR